MNDNQDITNSVLFQSNFNHISASDLHDILEYLIDTGRMNSSGIEFSQEFWETFIKQTKEE